MQQEWLTLPSGVAVRGSTGERYVIEGLLGKGEMGAVYLARDRHSKNIFALKEVIDPDEQDRERFLFEGEVLKRLNHRALPRVYRVFENDNLKRVYILMDYIRGRNLEDLRQEEPESRFSLSLALALMAPIVDALQYLHSQDPPIIHRDIKPANVIIPVGADEAMLVDFGSAKYVLGGTATVASRRTPGYAAPEQYSGGTSIRTDIYGLGATIYTLVTGTVPVDATSRFIRTWDQRGDLLKRANLLVPAIPAPVAQTLQRAMSVKSVDRFATVEEFWQTLNASVEPKREQVHIPRVTLDDVPPAQDRRETARKLNLSPEKGASALSSRRLAAVWLVFLVLLVILALGMHFLLHIF